MKKYLLFLLLAVSFAASAQSTYYISKPLQLNSVPLSDKKADSVLVYGAEKIVRLVPRSEFAGGSVSQNLQQTLSNGGDFVKNGTSNPSSLTTISMGSEGVSFYNGTGTDYATLSIGEGNLNIAKRGDSGITNFGFQPVTNFNTAKVLIPSKPGRTEPYILATLDDIGGGGGSQTLQQVLDNGASWTHPSGKAIFAFDPQIAPETYNLIYSTGDKQATFALGGTGVEGWGLAGTSTNFAASMQVYEGKFSLVQRGRLNGSDTWISKLIFDDPIAPSVSPAVFHVPAYDSGDYIFLTDADVPNLVKGTFYNDQDALNNGLVGGDLYRTYPDEQTKRSYVCQVKIIPDTKFKLFFADIDATMSNVGIADKNNVADWNNKLNPPIPFNSVLIAGNTATLTVKNRVGNGQYIFSNMELTMFDVLETDIETPIEIWLRNNNITVYNPEHTLPYNTILDLSYNNMVTFNPSDNMYFTELRLDNNNLAEFNPAHLVTVQDLSLIYNSLTSFEPANVNIGIRLHLRFNNLSSLNYDYTTYLQYLDLAGNEISEFHPSQDHPDLKYLDLSGNPLGYFDPEIKMPKLNTLVVGGSSFTTFDPKNRFYPELVNLSVINSFNFTYFNPVTILKYSKKLRSINIQNCGIEDFNPTVKIASEAFEELYITGCNSLTNFDPTIELPYTLRTLNLNSNHLTKFNPTQPLPIAIEEINISQNNITTTAWNEEVSWITSDLPFKRTITTNGNPNTVVGTTTQTELMGRNWTVQ